MSILGLVVEYNPFHLGHLHHLQSARQLTNPDAVVAVMSGNFTQRGEPAIVDKWARAEMALRLGADLVIELPVAWAVRSAAYFADGAVGLLASLGVTHICFGSEAGQIRPLTQAARLLLCESEAFREALHASLKLGKSFAEAQGDALRTVAPGLPENVFSEPNNTLGIQYIQSIMRNRFSITPLTIRREGHYHSLERNDRLPSARSIRSAIHAGDDTFGMPDIAREIMHQRFADGQGPVGWHDLVDLLVYRLRSLSREQVGDYPEAGEGLGIRLWEAVRGTHQLPEIIKQVKTRRFPLTRLQRLFCYVLLGLDNRLLSKITDKGTMALPYIRVLGINKANRAVGAMLSACDLPVLTNLSRQMILSKQARLSLELDIWATDCFGLAWQDSQAGLDYLHKFLVVERED